MFRYLRVKRRTEKLAIDPTRSAIEWLSQDECLPATLRQINSFPEGAKRRIYHALLPPGLPAFFDIDPVTWKGCGNFERVLKADAQSCMVNLSIQTTPFKPGMIRQKSFSAFSSQIIRSTESIWILL